MWAAASISAAIRHSPRQNSNDIRYLRAAIASTDFSGQKDVKQSIWFYLVVPATFSAPTLHPTSHAFMANPKEQAGPPAYPQARPEVEETGISILWEPTDEASIVADLVFVHGLGGHPELTWTKPMPSPEDDNAGSKKRKRNARLKEGVQTAFSCFWPYDLVRKDFRNLRIMTYGYDSDPCPGYSGTNEMTITHHARQLLVSLADERTDCQDRPLLFVGHSLGGVIVMDAINESKAYLSTKFECQRKVSEKCTGIFFFATPHQGSQLAKWAEISINFVHKLPLLPSVNPQILKQLKFDSDTLMRIERDFNTFRQSRPIDIYSFFEGIGLTNISPFNGMVRVLCNFPMVADILQVVPSISSSFNDRNIPEFTVNKANHMDMCKFGSETEPGYRRFKAALNGSLKEIARKKQAERVDQSIAQNAGS